MARLPPYPRTKPTAIPWIGEALPHVPDRPAGQADTWLDRSKDKVGYEINFTRYFYQYKALRPLSVIAKHILDLEDETEGLLKKILS